MKVHDFRNRRNSPLTNFASLFFCHLNFQFVPFVELLQQCCKWVIYIENCLSLNRFVSIRFKTVIIFISFVSHDFNFRIRFRRFVNDFVLRCARSFVYCRCVILIWIWLNAAIQTNEHTNQNRKYIILLSDFVTATIDIPGFTCYCFAKWNEMK